MAHGSLPPGVKRASDGTFESADGMESYDDVEMANIIERGAVPPSEQPQGTLIDRLEGVQILDLDDVLDRNEHADLVYAYHRLMPYIVYEADETASSDPFDVIMEVSTSSTLQLEPGVPNPSQPATDGIFRRQGVEFDDSLDLIGPPLAVHGINTVEDSPDAVGGGENLEVDEFEGAPTDPRFHPRDEVFVNVQIEGLDDSSAVNGLGYWLTAQYVFGVHTTGT